MEFECILYDVKDKVLTITLNRPDRLNAYTGQMQSNLIEAFDKAGKDDDIRQSLLQEQEEDSVPVLILVLEAILSTER